MLLISVGLVAVSLFTPNIGHLVALGITLSGLVYYFPFVYFNLNFKCFGKFFGFRFLILISVSKKIGP
jgi:hypothetical protein